VYTVHPRHRIDASVKYTPIHRNMYISSDLFYDEAIISIFVDFIDSVIFQTYTLITIRESFMIA